MNASWVITKREFASFFVTPVGYIFMLIFLSMSGVFTFMFGNLYERGEADLLPFFNFHPWLYLFLVPAIAMRSWSEERKSGTIELLMTLPLSTFSVVVGKFFAAWLVLAVCLLLTTPLWLTVNYLGNPDNGVIVASYLGSWLMSGAFLALSMCMSALTKNQVVAFVLSIVICFFFVLIGSPLVVNLMTDWAPSWVIDSVTGLSFLTHFQDIAKGVINANDLVFFILTIVLWLIANQLVIDQKKAS